MIDTNLQLTSTKSHDLNGGRQLGARKIFTIDRQSEQFISELIFQKVATEIEHILRLSKLKEYASH